MVYFNLVRGHDLVTEEMLEITHPLHELQTLAKAVLRNIETADKTLIDAMKTAAVPSMAVWNTFVPMYYYNTACRHYADKFTIINAADLGQIYEYMTLSPLERTRLTVMQNTYNNHLAKLQSEFHFLLDMNTIAGGEAFHQLMRRDEERKHLYADFNLTAKEFVKLVIENILDKYYWSV